MVLQPARRAPAAALLKRLACDLAEVIRRALSVYDFLPAEKASGNKLIIQGPDGPRELVLL